MRFSTHLVALMILVLSVSSVVLSEEDRRNGELELSVWQSSDISVPVPNANVRIVYRDGTVHPVSQGDLYGTVVLKKSLLEDATFVIICGRYFYCGAIDVSAADLAAFDEYSIDLAQWHT